MLIGPAGWAGFERRRCPAQLCKGPNEEDVADMTWSDRRYGEQLLPGRRSNAVVRNIIIATAAVWLFEMIAGRQAQAWVIYYFGLHPKGLVGKFFIWQPFTYVFVHSPRSAFHILFNMLCLWWLGQSVADVLGSKRFILLYLGAGVAAGLTYCLFRPAYPVVGASGAVMAVMVAFAVLFPETTILFMFIFPMKARYMAMLLIGISLVFSIAGSGGIAHTAHLGGALFGLLFFKFRPFVRAVSSEATNRRLKSQSLREQRERERVDEILDKINREGMGSLTQDERKFLLKASKNYRDRVGMR